MNHLLRTLTESQLEPTIDLRLLLTSVKEGRKAHEQKLSDAFYDALDGLLADLRMITVDNRDAEAFLKPVSRAEVPDYHDVISQPMDLQTMQKKVKQKAYKSKLEFQDDLNLIWTNCYTYNATENHPLRQCVKRLEQKANKLLQNITDRKDRMDPPLPSNLPASSSYSSSSSLAGMSRPRINGTSISGGSMSVNGAYLNGARTGAYGHGRTPSGNLVAKGYVKSFGNRRGVRFEDSPAIVRTPEGMRMFRDLNLGVGEVEMWEDMYPHNAHASGSGVGSGNERSRKETEARAVKQIELRDTLRELAPVMEVEVDVKEEEEDGMMSVDSPLVGGSAGEKRKLNGNTDHKPRKRAKVSTQYPTPLIEEKDDFSQLWWGAVQSDALLANGLPPIPFGPSSSKKVKVKRKKAKQQQPIAGPSTAATMSPVRSTKKPSSMSPVAFTTPTKAKQPSSSLMLTPGSPMNISPSHSQSQSHSQDQSTQPSSQSPIPANKNPKSLLSMMNNNIKTMRRVRHTHAKFLALNAMTAPQEDEEGAEGGQGYGGGGYGGGYGGAGGGGYGTANAMGVLDEEVGDDRIDEEPWTIERSGMWNRNFGPVDVGGVDAGPGVGASASASTGGRKGKGKDVGKKKVKQRDARLLSGVEMGEANASDCLHWSTSKVLEHVGFQGTSKVALDVFADVCGEYLSNVGRTIRFLTDKFGKTMSAEEIILHTLFESGTAKVQDLERYIKDDVERQGARLGELEKKLVSAYRETAGGEREMLEDEGLFEEDEDEEDAGALAFGDFADLLGEDYLGLRELGIAAESGLSNLTIPKKLLKGRKYQNKPTASKPTEPPPPYPPPRPFIPLTAEKVEDQIGLLRPYYQSRFTALAVQQAALAPKPLLPGPSIPSLPGPSISGLPGPKIPGVTPSAPGSNSLPVAPNTLPSAPNTLPSALNKLPAAPNTLPAAMNTLPSAPNTAPAPPPPPIPRPDMVLPDDAPPAAQVKMGPIGQIVRPGGGAGGGGVKKKLKVGATQGSGQSQSQGGGASQSQGGSGGGSGSGSQTQTQSQTQGQGTSSGATLQSGVLTPAVPVQTMSGVAALGMAGIPPPVGIGGGGMMNGGIGMGMGGGMGPVSYGMSASANGAGRDGGSMSPVKKVKAGG